MKHILVVEDDAVNAQLFRTLLERRFGCRVTVAERTEEVLSCARAGVDAIVMDVSLRDAVHEGEPVSGVDLCRILKSDMRTAGIPVILATAHAMRGDDEKLLGESGADDYVSKPIVDLDGFVRKIQRWLDQKAA